VSGRAVRLAAILVGSNTIRSLVVEADSRDAYRTLDAERVTTRLGEGLESRGEIAPEAMLRTIEALRRLVGITQAFQPAETRAIATSAVRDARNGPQFVERVRNEIGIELEVVSGEDEARLAWRSAAAEFDLGEGPCAVVDIGGASTEVVLADGGRPVAAHSLALGALRLAERLPDLDPIPPGALRRMRAAIRGVIEERLGGARGGEAAREDGAHAEGPRADGARAANAAPIAVGSGGTVSALARVAFGPAAEALPSLHGLSVSRVRLKRAFRRIRSMPFDERRRIPGLSPERAEILVPGAAALLEVMRAVGARRLHINERGLREGVLLEMIDRAFPEPAGGAAARADWLSGVLSFADTARFEKDHSLHVAHLAGLAFEALAPLHGLAPRDREILQAAAILHDIGHSGGARGHHRRAYETIRSARFPGLAPREVRLVALLVRYHRGARPRGRHPEFACLPRDERRRVMRLTAILRVVDGLDRGHAARIRGIGARIDGERVELQIDARENPDLELWGGGRKADLFERVFGRSVAFRVVNEAHAREGASGSAARS